MNDEYIERLYKALSAGSTVEQVIENMRELAAAFRKVEKSYADVMLREIRRIQWHPKT